jgi:hypothetical protein
MDGGSNRGSKQQAPAWQVVLVIVGGSILATVVGTLMWFTAIGVWR